LRSLVLESPRTLSDAMVMLSVTVAGSGRLGSVGAGAIARRHRGEPPAVAAVPMQSSLVSPLVSPRVRKPARQFLSFFCSILCIHVFVQSSQIIIERIRNVVVCSVDASKSCLVICFGSVARNLDMGSWFCASTILDSSHSR